MKINYKKILFAVVVAILLIFLVYNKLIKSSQTGAAQTGAGKKQAAIVSVAVVNPTSIEEKIFTTGTIMANEEVDLASEVSGKVIKISFNEGSKVKKGDLLVKINDSELQALLLKTTYSKKLAEEKEFRQKKMLEKEAISKEEYDVALSELNKLDAEIQQIKAQIEKTEIRAPFDGVIGLRTVSEGSYINPSTTVATLQNINPLKIDFSVPEKYFNQVKTGNQISFTIQGLKKTFIGKVYAIEPKIDPNTRTLKMRAISKNDNLELFPGSFALVELVLRKIDNAIVIPTEALTSDIKGQKVYVINKGKAFERQVVTGIRQDRSIQIVNGINAGDTIVTKGILNVKQGGPVKITEQK